MYFLSNNYIYICNLYRCYIKTNDLNINWILPTPSVPWNAIVRKILWMKFLIKFMWLSYNWLNYVHFNLQIYIISYKYSFTQIYLFSDKSVFHNRSLQILHSYFIQKFNDEVLFERLWKKIFQIYTNPHLYEYQSVKKL